MMNLSNSIIKGLHKIMSKIGILTVSSYRCSKLFEAVGLHCDLTDLCFQSVVSRIGVASFSDFELDLLNLYRKCKTLNRGRLLKYVHSGDGQDYHQYAVGLDTDMDLLQLKPNSQEIALDQVE
ncbi:glutamate synthase central domain-containing protein, partial [Sodalis-like endosymbiont of Proechinophthirus fluctus]|uniref:glutamate synthase central domain-containing protein n=1 Tax=Sodalis-like endosymbiont of Proechinophthirus fluctus TaxID=1462730 RepID=UPI0034E95180